MTRFKCPECDGMAFGLGAGRLSSRVKVSCAECGNTVAEFDKMDFTQ